MPADFRTIFHAIDGRDIKHLRAAVLIAGAVQTLLPIGLFVYLSYDTNPMGDGMEWVAIVPAVFYFLIFVLPALFLGAINRLLTIAALFAGAGAAVNLVFYTEIVREFSE